MNIRELTFTQEELARHDISSLPDRPSDMGITAEQLKSRFDQIGKQMVALSRYNDLIDALRSTQGDTGAQNIGALSGDVQTNVQSALDAKLPKSGIVQEAGSAEDKVMSQRAVTQAISGAGGGDMMRAEYDSVAGQGVVNEARLAQNAAMLDGKAAGAYYTNARTEVPAESFVMEPGFTAGALSYAFIQNDFLYFRFSVLYGGETWNEGRRIKAFTLTLPEGRHILGAANLQIVGDRESATTGVPCQGWMGNTGFVEITAFAYARVPTRLTIACACPLVLE